MEQISVFLSNEDHPDYDSDDHGIWVDFPVEAGKLDDILSTLGLRHGEYAHASAEIVEFKELEVDERFDNLIPEYPDLRELNYFAALLAKMDGYDQDKFLTGLVFAFGEEPESLKNLINIALNLRCFEFEFGVETPYALGSDHLQAACEDEAFLPLALKYFDRSAFGNDIAMELHGKFFGEGFGYRTGEPFVEFYRDSGDLPEGFRPSRALGLHGMGDAPAGPMDEPGR